MGLQKRVARHGGDGQLPTTGASRTAYDSKRNGYHKTVFYPNGDTYRGEWKDNNRHGLGTFKSPQKSFAYHGRWRDDLFDGYGEYWKALPNKTTKDQWISEYVGEWKQGKRHGYGIMRYTLRSYYEGAWDCGLRHGWGRLMYDDGQFYEGEWADDQRNGLGLLLYPNSNRYEGEFRADKKCGIGKFFFINIGQLMEGTWVNDVVRCSTLRNLVGYKTLPVCTQPTRYDIPPNELRDPKAVYDGQRQIHMSAIASQYEHRKTLNLTLLSPSEMHQRSRHRLAGNTLSFGGGGVEDNLPDYRAVLNIEALKAQAAATLPIRNTSVGATRVM